MFKLADYVIKLLKCKRTDRNKIDRLEFVESLIKQEEEKKLKKRKKITSPPAALISKINGDTLDDNEEFSNNQKDLLGKSKANRKLPLTENLLQSNATLNIAQAAAIFDSPAVRYTISEPVITRKDMDDALNIIARLENNLADNIQKTLATQLLLRRELDQSLAKQKVLEEEITVLKVLKVAEQELSAIEIQKLKEETESLRKDLDILNEEKFQALQMAGNLKEELSCIEAAIELKTKDWDSTLQKNVHSTQILALFSKLDSIENNWKHKVEVLEADLARERYESESKKIQYQLLKTQCQKSEKEAFHAKAMVKQVLEEMRVTKSQNDTLKMQLSQSFEFNAFTQF